MQRLISSLFTQDRKSLRTLHIFVLLIIILVIVTVYYYFSRPFGAEQRIPLLWHLTIFEFRNTLFGILFIIPLIYAAVFLNIKGLTATWLICGILILPRVTALSFHPESIMRAYLFYTLPFVISMLVKTEIMWRQIERKSSTEKEEQRQKYLSQVFIAHENERKNIARELHDSVIQSLIVLTNHAQSIISGRIHDVNKSRPENENNGVAEQVIVLRDMSREISRDIRNICLSLRPYILDDMGLIPALRWLINRTKTDIDISFTVEGEERRFSPEIELTIYRILQEAINNIRRHSKATEAKIHFRFDEGSLKISIEDNGRGFIYPENISALTAEGKLGLIGMQERVKLLNGNIRIVSGSGQGTLITIDAAIKY
ncbi:MAG: sensor histidine kinase [Dehalococcoidales bacterium]|nr:sensor histidine kinase [Dehalococcoidales bacterium]